METARHTARGALPRLLGSRDFVCLWALGGIGNGTRWLEVLAAGLWTFQATGSALAVAAVAMTRALPMLLLGALAGLLAERVDRRRFLIALQLTAVGSSLVIALLAFSGRLAVWHLILQGFVAGLAWAGEMATRRRMVAEAAPPGDLVAAVALDTVTGSSTRALGPLLGGALFQLLGIGAVASVAAGLHLVALSLAIRVRPQLTPVAPQRARSGGLAEIIDAARIALAQPALRLVLAVTLITNVFGFCYTAVLPAFGAAAFAASGTLIGLLAAAEPLGALLGGLAIASGRRPPRGSAAMLLGAGGFLAVLLLAAFAPAFWVCWLLLALGGLGTARFASLQTALVITHAPIEARSRTFGLVTTCIGMGPFGVLAVGWLADQAGPRLAIALMAGIGLAALLALAASRRGGG